MDVRQRVCEIIGKGLQVSETELTPDVYFRELPNADSMRLLQIILETENTFSVEIDDDVTFRIQTIGEYQDLVEKLCDQNVPT
jgi:acyl carrier protein